MSLKTRRIISSGGSETGEPELETIEIGGLIRVQPVRLSPTSTREMDKNSI